MAQLPNGSETIATGAAPAEVYAKVNANFQRLDLLGHDLVPIQFPGDAQATIFAKLVFPYDVLFEKALISSYAGAPAGGPLTVHAAGASASLPDGQLFAAAATGSSTWIAALTEITVEFTAVNGAKWPLVVLQFRKRVL